MTTLMNTKQAAKATGLSAYELRRGYKLGLYPAIEIGMSSKNKRLRWNMKMLEEAIFRNMEQAARERAESI